MNDNTKEELRALGVPENLLDYVYVVDGKIFAKQRIPKDLEKEYKEFKESRK